MKASRSKTVRKIVIIPTMCIMLLLMFTACVSKGPADFTEQSKQSKAMGELKIHYIDVGQADSILIQQAGQNMLIDAGNRADDSTIINYLKENGVSKLDVVVATHPHEDHIGAMDEVIKAFDIGTIYASNATTNTKTFKDFINAVKEKGLKLTRAVPETEFNIGNAKCTILGPNSNSYDNLNNYSVVVKLTYGSNKFIFQGDAEEIPENEILSKGYDISSDVLKVGHHGSSSSTTSKYLNKVNPKYAVISVGENNTYKHPHKETIEKLASKKITVYRTDEDGTIVAVSDGKNITFNVK